MTHYTIHAWNQHGVERDFGPFTAIQVLFGEVRVDSPGGTWCDEYARLDESGYWVFRDGSVAEGWSVEATTVLVEPEDETPEDETIILGPAEADVLAQQEGYPTADALVDANEHGNFTTHTCTVCGGPVVIDNDEPDYPKHVRPNLGNDVDRDKNHVPVLGPFPRAVREDAASMAAVDLQDDDEGA